jgi:Fe2+ transport system protein FeoA
MFMRGPITVEVDRVQLAIGYGMARRIIVRVKELAPEAIR